MPMTASSFGGFRFTMLLASVALLLSVCESGAFAANGKSTRLGITTSSLPNGQMGVPYTAMLEATGGTLPYQWSLASGTLPSGSINVKCAGPVAGSSGMLAGSRPADARRRLCSRTSWNSPTGCAV